MPRKGSQAHQDGDALEELRAQALGWECDTQRSWVPEAFQEETGNLSK